MSIGNGIAAGVMGVIGSYVSSGAVFWLTAVLGIPALVGLAANDDNLERACRNVLL